jgi:hypothetical protein
MARQQSFNSEQLVWLREIPLFEVLNRLCAQGYLFWRRDHDFKPEKDMHTIRLYVSSSSGLAWELLVTGSKWFDTRFKKGGGGGIDLVMHLFGIDFVAAVKLLLASFSSFR